MAGRVAEAVEAFVERCLLPLADGEVERFADTQLGGGSGLWRRSAA